MSNPWLYGWQFWLWMGPLLVVCFAVIGVAGWAFAWAVANPPWREPSSAATITGKRRSPGPREQAREAFHAAMARGGANAGPLLAELERGWARQDARDNKTKGGEQTMFHSNGGSHAMSQGVSNCVSSKDVREPWLFARTIPMRAMRNGW